MSKRFYTEKQKLKWRETKRTTLFLCSFKKGNFFDEGGAIALIAPNQLP